MDIRIFGTYKRYLFRNDVFKGHITLTNNKLTYSSRAFLADISFHDWYNMKSSWFVYYSSVYHKSMDGGKIHISGAFNKVIINVCDKDGKLTDYYISAPANDRQAAFDLADKMGCVDFYNLS